MVFSRVEQVQNCVKNLLRSYEILSSYIITSKNGIVWKADIGTGSKKVMVNSGGTFNGDSAFGRRREKKGSRFSASFLPFLLNEVREREGRGGEGEK